jgi:hypothetical protein
MLDGIGKGEGCEDCIVEDAEVDEVLSGVNVLICLLRTAGPTTVLNK